MLILTVVYKVCLLVAGKHPIVIFRIVVTQIISLIRLYIETYCRRYDLLKEV